MSKLFRYKQFPNECGEFNWSMFEDGWNGTTVKVNKTIKTGEKGYNIYSHEPYAAEIFEKYTHKVPISKELKKNTLVSITDIIPGKKDTVLATINGGSNNIIIDLNKEQRYLDIVQINGHTITKDEFIECLKAPETKQALLDMNLVAKVSTDVEKASIWDGYVEMLSNEMREQIHKNEKAYYATILSCNNGGYIVEITNTIKAFMPGSMAAANKLTNYESLVGTSMEVMVESYDPKIGFVVSRKKYLHTVTPLHLMELREQLKENKDTIITGTVTGTTPFGIFVELTNVLTGMIHKTLMSDTLREQLRQNKIEAGTQILVYVHNIEKGRIILSDVISSERDEVIKRREEEDAAEKQAYMANKFTKKEVANEVTSSVIANNAGEDLNLVNE